MTTRDSQPDTKSLPSTPSHTEGRGRHTPGPWLLSDGWSPTVSVVDLMNVYGSYQAGVVAKVVMSAQDGHYTDERSANARLIAAAPDLLDAAKEALVQAEGCWREHYGEDPEAAECPTPRHIALLRAAIARAATGGK